MNENLQNHITVNTLPSNQYKAWLRTGHKILFENYGLILGSTIFYLAVGIMGNAGGGFGQLLGLICQMLILPGQMLLISDLVHKRETSFSRIFAVFNEKSLLGKIYPYYIVLALLFALVFGVAFVVALIPISLVIKAIFAVIFAIGLAITMPAVVFIMPLMLFKNLRAEAALKNSFRGFWANLGPLVIYGFVLLLISFLSVLLLALPFILWTLPYFFVSSYVIYFTIFETGELVAERGALSVNRSP